MTDRLRDLFDDMLGGEPPLRTTPDEAARAGRRLRTRRRTLWTVTGTALAVVAAAAAPARVIALGGPAAALGQPSSAAVAPPSPIPATPAPTPSNALSSFVRCPGTDPRPALDSTDGSVLPDPSRSAAAVMAAASRIAPDRRFILRTSTSVAPSAKAPGIPTVYLIFDVGDGDGFGAINVQVMPEVGATPRARAGLNLDGLDACRDVAWRDYPDGSVALYYAYGPPEQERQVTHVWYFASAGFTMNIGCFPQSWTSSDDPNKAPPPPPLPVRTTMPLSITQIMDVADVIAHSAVRPSTATTR